MKNWSLKTKILSFFISVFMLLSAILSSITLALYSDFLKNKTHQLYQSSMQILVENTNHYFDNLRDITYVSCYNSFSDGFLNSPAKDTTYEYFKESEKFKLILKNMEQIKADTKILFFAEKHAKTYHNLYQEYNLDYHYQEDEWYQILSRSEQSELILAQNPQSYKLPSYQKPEATYAVIYKIFNYFDGSVSGYMLIQIAKNSITSLLRNDNVMCEDLLIYDRALGSVIFDNREDHGRWDLTLQKIAQEKTASTNSIESVVDGRNGITLYSTPKSPNWLFVLHSSYSFLLSELPLLLLFCIASAGVLCLLCIVLMIRFTKWLTQPLEALNQGFNRVKKSDFSVQLTPTSMDELGSLIANFNMMVEKIDFFVNQSKDTRLLLKQAELDALQQQINPHFLYNTLEMIIGMAICEQSADVIRACTLLGRIFKFNLLNKDFVTVSQELDYVKNYVEITQLRFSGKFDVHYFVDPGTLTQLIMKFTLQPFVENAIVHGFSDLLTGGVVQIWLQKNEWELLLRVEDNGKGFSEEILKHLYWQIEQFDSNNDEKMIPDSHIGILNVILRLKLNLKDDLFFEIKNLNPGSRISIKVPLDLMEGVRHENSLDC